VSREQKGEYGFQKDKITSLSFSKDGTKLISTSTDLAFGVVDITTGVNKLKKNPHDVKQVTRAIIAANNEVYTSGEDCAIRIWTGF
jgi:WD40 repeat protein